MGERLRAAREIPGVGIEVVVVEGQGDAVVAGLRDKGEGVVEAVVRGAVGIVGEPEGHLAFAPRSRASAGTWRAGARGGGRGGRGVGARRGGWYGGRAGGSPRVRSAFEGERRYVAAGLAVEGVEATYGPPKRRVVKPGRPAELLRRGLGEQDAPGLRAVLRRLPEAEEGAATVEEAAEVTGPDAPVAYGLDL